MSVTAYFYIGPYIVVTTELEDSFTIERKCENVDCDRKKKLQTKFCPQCGTEGTDIKIPCKVQKDWCPEELELHRHFEIPHAGGVDMEDSANILMDSEFGYSLDDTDMGCLIPIFEEGKMLLPEDSPIEKLEKFKTKHAEVIKQLQDYGAKLKFYYGMICHGS